MAKKIDIYIAPARQGKNRGQKAKPFEYFCTTERSNTVREAITRLSRASITVAGSGKKATFGDIVPVSGPYTRNYTDGQWVLKGHIQTH